MTMVSLYIIASTEYKVRIHITCIADPLHARLSTGFNPHPLLGLSKIGNRYTLYSVLPVIMPLVCWRLWANIDRLGRRLYNGGWVSDGLSATPVKQHVKSNGEIDKSQKNNSIRTCILEII